MTSRLRKYAVLLSLNAIVAAVLIFGIAADSANAAFFLNGVMANIFDPFIWVIALPFAVKIRNNAILLPTLFVVAALVAILKLYLPHELGTRLIVGSFAGNVVGLMAVGYLINAIAVARRGHLEMHDKQVAGAMLNVTRPLKFNPFFCKTEGMRRLTIALSVVSVFTWIVFLAFVSEGFSTITPKLGVLAAIAIPPLAAYIVILGLRAAVLWIARGFQSQRTSGG